MKRAWIIGMLIAAGCGSSSSGSGFANGSGAGGNPDGTGAVLGGSDGGSGSIDPSVRGPDGCTDDAKLVYVLSQENDLYSFAPLAKVFKRIGTLGCKANGATPNSMAIDRNAVAWVNYAAGDQLTGQDTAGAIFKVSTKDASCTSTNIRLQKPWFRLGMGFSTEKVAGAAETLFVTATGDPLTGGSAGLGRIDLSAQTLIPIGGFGGSLSGQNAELTGTGDARLFGFFTTKPVQIAEIDKASAAILSTKSIAGVETPAAWAFSFWGGDFYLYTAPDEMLNPGRTSNVTHYSPKTAQSEPSYMTNVGFRIVGAGVSTCAPTEPPK